MGYCHVNRAINSDLNKSKSKFAGKYNKKRDLFFLLFCLEYICNVVEVNSLLPSHRNILIFSANVA